MAVRRMGRAVGFAKSYFGTGGGWGGANCQVDMMYESGAASLRYVEIS